MENKESKKPLVLVIEDDPFLLDIYSDKLGKSGFEVELARNGEEGVAAAKKNRPDIVLLDLVLPKKDGFEVLKSIKTDPDIKDIKVLILSNLKQEDKKPFLEMGALDYIVKADVSFREIVDIVKKHLNLT